MCECFDWSQKKNKQSVVSSVNVPEKVEQVARNPVLRVLRREKDKILTPEGYRYRLNAYRNHAKENSDPIKPEVNGFTQIDRHKYLK